MNRAEILETYGPVDASGVIRCPGKFEAEPIYVPYFWDRANMGEADEDLGSTVFFRIEDEDRKEFPEIGADVYGIGLEESSNGFVNRREFLTAEDYDNAVEEASKDIGDGEGW